MALSAYVDEFSRQPWRSLLLLSGAGVACLLLTDLHHQHSSVSWATMLLAMMPPLLAQPVIHVLRSTRNDRRIRALLAFVVGYALIWMLAGLLLISIAMLIAKVGIDDIAAPLIVTSVAIIWSASPWHQAALNRAHRVRSLAVFGLQANLDAIVYGLVHGAWCVASCWAWMLVPLATHDDHAIVMVLITLIMLVERLAPPVRPTWRFPLPLRLLLNRFAHV